MAVSATTGVLNPLLGKLGQLLGEEYKKLTGVRKQASFLKDELSAMKALLDKMELMDKLDPSAKNWRDHIREMSYDMENCIDDFIHDIEGASAKKGFVRKMVQRLRRLGRVHDMMLDLILSKSTKDNFISVAYNYEDMARLHSCKYKVRRLSLQSGVGGATSETLATSMPQVRSYVQFRESQYTPQLSQFKYLRVLTLEFPLGLETTVDLTAISHLFLLRYLNVKAISLALPAEIQGLVHLQNLVVYCKRTQSFPSDISFLASLFHLVLPWDIPLPEGIKKMKSLRTMRCWNLWKSSLEDIKGLGELANLTELYLGPYDGKCLTLEQEDALVSSIGMLQDLKRLELIWKRGCSDPDSQLDTLHDPPPRLKVLSLPRWVFRRVPKWISELCCLWMLDLHVLHLSSDEVRVLGELPSLVYVRLKVSDVSQDKVVVGLGLFPVLEHFCFGSDKDVNVYLSFEAGAMPKVQSLGLEFSWCEWRGATPVGMECLPCLQDIHLYHQYSSTSKSDKNWEDVCADLESAFKSAASLHPRHPSVSVQ